MRSLRAGAGTPHALLRLFFSGSGNRPGPRGIQAFEMHPGGRRMHDPATPVTSGWQLALVTGVCALLAAATADAWPEQCKFAAERALTLDTHGNREARNRRTRWRPQGPLGLRDDDQRLGPRLRLECCAARANADSQHPRRGQRARLRADTRRAGRPRRRWLCDARSHRAGASGTRDRDHGHER